MTHPWTLVAALVLLVCLATPGTAECDVSTIGVQEDFDLEKYIGTWYELEWIPAYFENFTDFYTDYFEDYKATDGGMEGTLVGRSGEKCIVSTRTYLKTDTPGKLTYKTVVYGTDYAMEYWVISTDYVDYALVWGCTKQTGDLCDKHHMWVFGRGSTIKEASQNTVRSYYENLCILGEDLVETTHEEACELPGSGSGSVAALVWLTPLASLALLSSVLTHL